MTRQTHLQHEFVESFPDEMEDGRLYVSIPFKTMGHKCCCGCGLEVITPLTPRDWRMAFDGETLSVFPSIGNWSFPCQSHYWIKNGRIEWSGRMSKEQIDRIRLLDRESKDAFYYPSAPVTSDPPLATQIGTPRSFWSKLVGWFR